MALSGKVKNNLLILLDYNPSTARPKTKWLANILKKLPSKEKNTLIALPKYDKNIILAARNLPNVETIEARNLNCLDILSFKYLIMLKETVKVIKETFLK